MLKCKKWVRFKFLGICLVFVAFFSNVITYKIYEQSLLLNDFDKAEHSPFIINFSTKEKEYIVNEVSNEIETSEISNLELNIYSQKYNNESFVPKSKNEIPSNSKSPETGDKEMDISESCPKITKECVPCKVSDGHWACRYLPGDEWGYLGWACQNNDPSNIYYAQFKVDIILQVGGPAPCGNRGGYMAFRTYEEGFNGVKAYIKAISAGLHPAYITNEFKCGDCTLLQFFSKYAPGNDNGLTYASKVVSRIGGEATLDTKLNWIVDNKLDTLVEAIQCNEGFFVKSGDGYMLLCNL